MILSTITARKSVNIDRIPKYRPQDRPHRNSHFCRSFVLCKALAVDAVDILLTLLLSASSNGLTRLLVVHKMSSGGGGRAPPATYNQGEEPIFANLGELQSFTGPPLDRAMVELQAWSV